MHYKLIFFVPKNAAESVKEAVFNAGGGQYAHYSCCAWQTLGQGQFKPSELGAPHIGKHDELTYVDEYRVEILCDSASIKNSIKALIATHPYEEPAYEVIKLEQINI